LRALQSDKGDNTMNTTEINIDKLQSQLDAWKADVAKLEARARSANADAQLAYLREVDDLKAKYAEAETKLDQLRKAQKGASSDVMDGITSAWRDLGNAVSKAASRFN